MGYFDAIVAGSFKTSAEGHTLFFPWGALGRGLVVPSEDENRRIRASLRRLYIGLMVLVVVLLQMTPVWVPLVCWLPYSVFYVFWMRRTTRGWKRTTERLSIREAQASAARSMSGWIVWTLLLFSAGILALSVFLSIAEPRARIAAIPGAALGGLGCFVYLRMMRAQRAARLAVPPSAP